MLTKVSLCHRVVESQQLNVRQRNLGPGRLPVACAACASCLVHALLENGQVHYCGRKMPESPPFTGRNIVSRPVAESYWDEGRH